MKKIHCLLLNLDILSFYGLNFDPEVLYHFRDLEIAQITHLAYGFRCLEEEDEYIKYKRDYPIEVIDRTQIKEMKIKSSFDLIDPFENDGDTFINEAHIEFKNGLKVQYSEGSLAFQIKNNQLYYTYTGLLLKQYGVIADEIYELSRLYPSCELYCDRPGIFKARVPIQRDNELKYEFLP